MPSEVSAAELTGAEYFFSLDRVMGISCHAEGWNFGAGRLGPGGVGGVGGAAERI